MFHPLDLNEWRQPLQLYKLDGVGPVDNGPSTDKLHHFVTCDMWHVTGYTGHMTCDMFWGVNILSKFQLPSSYGLWFMVSWRLGGKADGLTNWPGPGFTGSVKYALHTYLNFMTELTSRVPQGGYVEYIYWVSSLWQLKWVC